MINIMKFHVSSSKSALTHKPFTGTVERNQTHWTSHITDCFFHTSELSFLGINIVLVNFVGENDQIVCLAESDQLRKRVLRHDLTGRVAWVYDDHGFWNNSSRIFMVVCSL